jgi:acylphosphatase
MQAERFFVSGRVQGVGFRYAAHRRARELGLTGYVHNLPDGRVEALAQGEPADIDAFAEWLQRGPPLAQVDDVQRAPASIEQTTLFGFG